MGFCLLFHSFSYFVYFDTPLHYLEEEKKSIFSYTFVLLHTFEECCTIWKLKNKTKNWKFLANIGIPLPTFFPTLFQTLAPFFKLLFIFAFIAGGRIDRRPGINYSLIGLHFVEKPSLVNFTWLQRLSIWDKMCRKNSDQIHIIFSPSLWLQYALLSLPG